MSKWWVTALVVVAALSCGKVSSNITGGDANTPDDDANTPDGDAHLCVLDSDKFDDGCTLAP